MPTRWLKSRPSGDSEALLVCAKVEKVNCLPVGNRALSGIRCRTPEGAPARRRAGGRDWRRTFGSSCPGDPAWIRGRRWLGRAWARARGNRLGCGRGGGRNSDSKDGRTLFVAHVDGEPMTSALEAPGLADLANRRLRALRPRKSRNSSEVCRAARKQTRVTQPSRREASE